MKNKSYKVLSILLIMLMVLGTTIVSYGIDINYEKQSFTTETIKYFNNIQNPDGGFPSKDGELSDKGSSSWAIMALIGAGEDLNSNKWKKNGISPVDYVLDAYKNENSSLEYSKLLMILSANKKDSTYEGKDIGELLESFQKQDGQFYQEDLAEKNMINVHMWTTLALTSAKLNIDEKELAIDWLKANQNEDGGFGWFVGVDSDTDDTAIAIQTLVALGDKPSDSDSLTNALKYLKSKQNEDGGFSSGDWMSSSSNTASTAWAVQSIIAVLENPEDEEWSINNANGITYLLSQLNGDGSVNWKEDVSAAKTKMTAYALMAVSEKPFPVNINYQEIIEPKFSDLNYKYWANDEIIDLVDNGIISGYPDGTFKPENNVTRAEFTTMIIKAIGKEQEAVAGVSSFTDLQNNHWAYNYVRVALQNKIINGRNETTFDPNGKITGGELATILVNTLGDKIDLNLEIESKVEWYAINVKYAERENLLYPEFDPKKYASRAECAYSINKLSKIIK